MEVAPDIIIFNPKVGVQIIEVNDWNFDNYDFNKSKLYVSNCSGRYEIKSPIKQVEYYKEKLIGQLVPQIGEKIDGNRIEYGLIKTAIYFHKASTQKTKDFFKKPSKRRK